MKSKSQPNLFDGELMTIERLAKEFGRSTRTIMRWCKRGDFAPRVKVGRNFYFKRDAVLAFFANNATASGHKAAKRTRRAS